jgi:hypothetical protein
VAKKILVIPDLHIPYHHPSAFDFLDALNEKLKPDLVINLGDEVDHHSISFHQHDADLLSPSSELEKAIFYLKDLSLIFPRMILLDSNHGSLYFRKIKANGLPSTIIKPLGQIYGTPKGWKWVSEYFLKLPTGDMVYFHHGKSSAPMGLSKNMGMCSVEGHHHGRFGVYYWSNGWKTFWGLHSGCLIDIKSLAFAYGKNNLPQPILGASVIIDGTPIPIRMCLDKKGLWDRQLPI